MTDSNELNPYAPPKSPAVPVPTQTLREPRVEGNCIVVNSGIALPLRCVVTNTTCDLTNQRRRKLSYAPSFRLVTWHRTCSVYCCVSKSKRKRYLLLSLLAYSLFFVLLWLSCGIILLAVVFATAALSTVSPDRLKVVNYRNGEFWIKGLPNEYLELLVVQDGWKRVSR